MANDIHNYKKKYAREISKIEESKKINLKDRKLILDFQNYCFSKGLSYARISRYLQTFRTLVNRFGFTFHNAEKNDIINILATINSTVYTTATGLKKEYSENTKLEFRKFLKKFYKWVEKPELVEDFTIHIPKSKRKLPDKADLPTPQEVLRLIQKARNYRDKCLVALLYETGARIGEISNIRLSDIVFEKEYAVLKLRGKTGERVVPIRNSYEYLKTWYENHPLKNDSRALKEKKDFMFIVLSNHNKYEPLNYGSLVRTLKRLGKEANIDKRLNPHSFRHARASDMAKELTEAQMNQYFGWTQGSEMTSTYVHLSGRDIVDAMKKKWGLIEDQKNDNGFSLKCPRCKTLNAPTNNYCKVCDFVLNEDLANELERRKNIRENFLEENKEVLIQMVKEWQSKKGNGS